MRNPSPEKEMSRLLLLLLDKGVVRRYVEGYVRSARNQPLTAEQQLAQVLLHARSNVRFVVSRELVNLLRLHAPTRIVAQLAPLLQVLLPTKYQRRWARRLHQDFGFGREDAHLLSLATFGTDTSGSILGVDLFVSFDVKCLDCFVANFPAIEKRFSHMVSHLSRPYGMAELPEVATPTEALDLLSTPAEEDP